LVESFEQAIVKGGITNKRCCLGIVPLPENSPSLMRPYNVLWEMEKGVRGSTANVNPK
jgi:hypothetical protein